MTHGTGRAPRWGARVVVATVAVSGLSILGGQARAGVKEGPAFVGDDRRPPAAVDEARWLVRAQKAIAAAESQIGVPYVYAAARPGRGFDCSGLVMWAWGDAGVRLPHNSTDQYLALPHVPRSVLRPGDILYFREPMDHVAIYLGRGLMIHAPHTGDHVRIQRVPWRYLFGVARP